jgi:hypothetical protein
MKIKEQCSQAQEMLQNQQIKIFKMKDVEIKCT